ncbi:hypothetical protein TVAG_452650 [Trichomonas vaginalis G3]|uniref:Uncharacterized protein n=1 Tax=Trichomonas vaginalis (strain ATCC PRA-98 / G3) TaxID=412133 RepID=A2DJY6_TRIV3|nr:hypothetical protein TVAGG3_0290850 [Trichomonas vaginalis G3]EAY19350.1 hypothetical protein TVAG_452650 [Trichomonas vaginalis G3]KAI5527257.1 hypothetical protein TVAGG3_0290850 [Trichomonas vaginalis G3]|eukprot:XP_001580336.1 hypothetical protein [Trichomonas vaginalis G3]
MSEENLDGFDISVPKTPSLDDLGTKSPQKSDLPSSQIQKSASLDEISLESNATTEIGPATQPLFFDDEDEMNLAESTTMSAATSTTSVHPTFKLAEPQEAFNPVTGVTIRRLEDFQLQLTNRSAFRHMREGVFKELFLKNHKSYKVKAEAHQMAVGYTPDEAELSLVPDIHNATQEKALDQLSRSKNMTFEEKMQKKLEDEYNVTTKVNKFSSQNIFAVVTEQYRQKDTVIAANPLPVIDVIPDDEGPLIKFANNVFTSELFDVKKDSEVYKPTENFEPKNVRKIYENLVSLGIDFEKCGIKLPQILQKDIDVLFYELLGRAPDSEFPALLSTVLLHGCNSIQNVYLALSTLSYTVVEVSNTLLSYPFYDFAGCCRFFAKLLNVHCTPYLFTAIDHSERFKETCYRKDALINLPLFVQAISALSTPSNISQFSMNPPPIYNYVNLSIVIDDLCKQLKTSKIYAFLRPITSSSPMAQLAYTVLYYYDKDFDIQNIGWVFSKIASKHMIFIKYSKIKEMPKLAQIIAFILELILTEKYHLFFLETYIQTQKLIKMKYSVESIVLLVDSLVKLQKILHEDSLPSLIEVSVDIAKLLSSK